nr:8788_t:CDS:10 [Entrophospora candida]
MDHPKCVIEDFVPSGVKNFQKKLKAKKSLQILVTHLTVQPPDPLISQDAKQQQLYMLKKYQKFLYTLLKNYFLQDFFDVIIDNKDADQNDRFYEWKEFISLICSIPDRYLTQVLKSLTTTWSDTTFVKHASNSLQLYVTSAILIIFGYLPKEILLKINIYKDIGVGTTQWMKSSFDRTRKIAMVTVEMLSWLLDGNDDVLDFKLDPQDEEVKTLRQLQDLSYIIFNTENRSFKRNKDINDENNSQSISVISNSFEEDFDQSSNVIDEDETKLVGDSDDEDDFEPYPMDESDFEENEEDYDTLATKPKNTLPPVYIIDLIKMLKAAEDPEKIEIAMNTAEKLIRLKTNFGTELDENANELARVLISINNTFELKEFEEKRHAALTALVVGSPKNTVLYIIKEFFEKRYSLSEKITMLSVLASGAKELAGIEQPEEIEVRRKSSIIDLLSKQTSSLSVNAIETSKEPSPSSNSKVNRFSRKPMVQSIHSSSIKVNRFNEFAAKPFFFPLSAGFWNWIRNRDTINKGMYEPILLSKYITTLATIVQCSTNTVENLEISKEFWDMILSLRYFDDVAVVSSLLFGISVILKALPEQELATFFSKDLIETNQWVTNLFENNPNEYVKSISAWIMVKIDQIISKYRRLLIEEIKNPEIMNAETNLANIIPTNHNNNTSVVDVIDSIENHLPTQESKSSSKESSILVLILGCGVGYMIRIYTLKIDVKALEQKNNPFIDNKNINKVSSMELESKSESKSTITILSISPKIDKVLNKTFDYIMRDIIDVYCEPIDENNEKELSKNIRNSMNSMAINLSLCLKNLDKIELGVMSSYTIANSFIVHLREYRKFIAANESLDVYCDKNQSSPLAFTTSKQIQTQNLRSLSRLILSRFLPSSESQSQILMAFLTELWTNNIFSPLLDTISDPDWLNCTIVDYLSDEGSNEDEGTFFQQLASSLEEEVAGLAEKLLQDPITTTAASAVDTSPSSNNEQGQSIYSHTNDLSSSRSSRNSIDMTSARFKNLQSVLNRKSEIFAEFMAFLEEREAANLLRFWLQVDSFKKIASNEIDTSLIQEDAIGIFKTYFGEAATYPVKVTNDKLIKQCINEITKAPGFNCFISLQEYVFNVLEEKYFDDFIEDMKGQGEDMSFLIYEDEPKQKNKNEIESPTKEENLFKMNENGENGFSGKLIETEKESQEIIFNNPYHEKNSSSSSAKDNHNGLTENDNSSSKRYNTINDSLSILKSTNEETLDDDGNKINYLYSTPDESITRSYSVEDPLIENSDEKYTEKLYDSDPETNSVHFRSANTRMDLTGVSIKMCEVSESRFNNIIYSKKNLAYMIEVEQPGSTGWIMTRSFADFEAMHIALVNQFPKAEKVTMPRLMLKKNYDACQDLQRYLNILLSDSTLAKSDPLQKFMKRDGLPNEGLSLPKSKRARGLSILSIPKSMSMVNLVAGVNNIANNLQITDGGGNRRNSLEKKKFGFDFSLQKSFSEITSRKPIEPSLSQLSQPPLLSDPPKKTIENFERLLPSLPIENGLTERSDEIFKFKKIAHSAKPSVDSNASSWVSVTPTSSMNDSFSGQINSNDSNDSNRITTRSNDNSHISSYEDDNHSKNNSASKSKTNRPNKVLTGQEIDILIDTVFAIVEEIFDLSMKSQWHLRKTVLSVLREVVRRSYTDAIRQSFLINIHKLTTEENVASMIDDFKNSFWPNGVWEESGPTRTEEEKIQTKETAKRLLLQKAMPESLLRVMGYENSRIMVNRLVDGFLDEKEIIRGMFVGILENIVKLIITE